MLEFTGERVVPGRVNPDLWNEHRARYLFARKLCAGRRVLDLGCGTGYGAWELASVADQVIALDVSPEALAFARAHYGRPNLAFVRAAAPELPFRPASFDVVVAFELIEHVAEWQETLRRTREVLRAGGCFIVSTPNRIYYAESRRLSGPNPYHVREFDFEEFRRALLEVYPQAAFYLENHAAGIAFEAVGGAPSELLLERRCPEPDEANFFVAVCGNGELPSPPSLVYLPSAANALRERAEHIQLLEKELATKDRWLEELQQKHSRLVGTFKKLEEELEERNRWAADLNEELAAARREIERLNAELAEQAAGYEAKIAALEVEVQAHADWARRTRHELDDKLRELARCVELLHEAERTVEERTLWAQRLDAEVRRLEAQLSLVQASRWVRLGRKLGLGPELAQG